MNLGRSGLRIVQSVPPSKEWRLLEARLRAGEAEAVLHDLHGRLVLAGGTLTEVTIREQIAAAYALTGDPKRAIVELHEAINRARERNTTIIGRLHLFLGSIFQIDNQVAEALEAYGHGIESLIDLAFQFIQKDANNPHIRTEFRGTDKALVLGPQFLNQVRRYCSVDPTFASIRNNMGVCFAMLGQLDEAESMFREAIDFLPTGYRMEAPVANLREIAAARPIRPARPTAPPDQRHGLLRSVQAKRVTANDPAYTFAHRALPMFALGNPGKFYKDLAGAGASRYLVSLWDGVCARLGRTKAHGGLPVTSYDASTGYEVYVIQLPPAAQAPDAIFVAVAFKCSTRFPSRKIDEVRYFTLELGEHPINLRAQYHVGEWTGRAPELKHVNHGQLAHIDLDEFLVVLARELSR